MSDPPPFTALELMRCAAREMRYRRRVYPGLVAKGRMTEAEAQREIDMMAEIALHFSYLVPDLFREP